MDQKSLISDKHFAIRSAWIKILGGILSFSVKNQEWLELLIEDGRNRMMIEGEFDDRWNLKEILKNLRYEKISAKKILNFFDTAIFAYEKSLIDFKDKDFPITIPFIKHLHRKLFREIPRGFSQNISEFAKEKRTINQSGAQTISAEKIEKKLQELINYTKKSEESPFLKSIIFHALFELIHPFPDGNGPIVRILLNCLLLSLGFPSVVIKGMQESERQNYYQVLKKADQESSRILSGQKSWEKLSIIGYKPLQNLLKKELAESFDIIIYNMFRRNKKNLIPLSFIAQKTNKSFQALSVACSQKKYISILEKGKRVSHPFLFFFPE